jgi:hypothetical protein
MSVEITEAELSKRKSNGSVFICRSCKDNKNKIVLVEYKKGAQRGVHYQFCQDCLKLIDECARCNSKLPPSPQL